MTFRMSLWYVWRSPAAANWNTLHERQFKQRKALPFHVATISIDGIILNQT